MTSWSRRASALNTLPNENDISIPFASSSEMLKRQRVCQHVSDGIRIFLRVFDEFFLVHRLKVEFVNSHGCRWRRQHRCQHVKLLLVLGVGPDRKARMVVTSALVAALVVGVSRGMCRRNLTA